MARQDICFVDPIVSEKAIRRFRIRPILRCLRYRRPNLPGKLLQQMAHALAVAHILESASHHFIVYLFIRPGLRRLPALGGPNTSQLPHVQQSATLRHTPVSTSLETEDI